MFPSLFSNLFHSLFLTFYNPYPPPTYVASGGASRLTFQLRHLHATSEHGHVLFSDVDCRPLCGGNLTTYVSEIYTLDTKFTSIHRPRSFDAIEDARYRSMKFDQSTQLDWHEDEIIGPDTESRETLLALAKMTSNAYLQPNDKGWYSLGGNWTTVRLTLTLALNNPFTTHAGV